MPPLPALLIVVTLLGGYASARLHAAADAALREVRAGERRLDPAAGEGPGRRLEDELRSLAEVAGSAAASGWRESAALAALLSAVAVTLGIWTLTDEQPAPTAFAVVALALATVLVTALLVVDGARTSATLAAAVRRHPLGGVLQLESSLAAVDALPDPAAMPTRPISVARLRDAARRRAARRRAAALSRVPPTDVPAARVALPPGYAEGVRGLRTLLTASAPGGDPADHGDAGAGPPETSRAGPVDDPTWEAALADLGRAAELDAPRRTRWLSALAACAELRDDPPARESAARWTLEAAASPQPPGRRTDPRTDPMPGSVAVRPAHPDTWAGALRRAVAVGAPAEPAADVTVRWAYSLVAGAPRSAPALLEPAVAAAVDITRTAPDGERYLTLVRPGLERLGASSTQMARLVPPRPTARPRSSSTEPAPAGTAVDPTARGRRPAGGASAVPPRDT